MNEEDIRNFIFIWLTQRRNRNGGVFSRLELSKECIIDNRLIILVGPTGIWIPQNFSIPISITTTSKNPYKDEFNLDGSITYSYRGENIYHRDNVGLRNALIKKTPLIYFHSIRPGKYFAIFPIYIIEDNPNQLSIRAEVDPIFAIPEDRVSQITSKPDFDSNRIIRKYISVLTKRRLHQTVFREFVLDAYDRQCSLCRLKHQELLDAAHIIQDSEEEGEPIVSNGLSLCKIHHAAFDQKIIGISPDYEIKVRTDILEETDGPMLTHGLQSLEGGKLILPLKRINYPDKARLEKRYSEFLNL